MNIFKVLSSCNGRISETNISAMLVYLLDPTKDHGFRDSFLKKIIKKLIDGKNNQKLNDYWSNPLAYKIRIIYELPVDVKEPTSDKFKRYIDIVLEFSKTATSDKNIPEFAVAIENKIRDDSLSDLDQIHDEMSGLKKNYDDEKNYPELHCILICPEYNDKVTKSLEKISDYNNTHLLWKGDASIIQILNEILEDEANGTIDPLSTEIKYTIRSFIAFIKNDFQSDDVKAKESRERVDYGGKLIKDYLLQVYEGLDSTKEYKAKEIKDMLSKKVEDGSGQILDKSTRNSQFYKATVNSPSRTGFGINKPLDNDFNLFYYTKNRKIKKFDKNSKEDIDIYWLKDGERVSEKLSILREKDNF